MKEDFLVSSKYLKEKAGDVRFKLLDARWYLEDINLGQKEYIKGHIPNALFFDIEKFSECSSLLPHTIISNRDFENKVICLFFLGNLLLPFLAGITAKIDLLCIIIIMYHYKNIFIGFLYFHLFISSTIGFNILSLVNALL